jgi:cell division topological specificity factor
MSNFLGLGRRRKASGEVAKERLKLVLVHDRSGLSPQQLEALKDELLKVIARYVDIDHEGVEINLAQNERENRLQADIPIRAATRRTRRAASLDTSD